MSGTVNRGSEVKKTEIITSGTSVRRIEVSETSGPKYTVRVEDLKENNSFEITYRTVRGVTRYLNQELAADD